jgi:2-amino-4-hydroxy-6-hydroxymethyldihydropteridine diphosphokinase
VYSDREIDVDILLYDDLQMDTPELTIPHPRMWQRSFVVEPLRELGITLPV